MGPSQGLAFTLNIMDIYIYIYSFIFGCTRSSLLRGLSLVAVSWGYSLVAVHGLLIEVVSLIVEHRHTG